MNKSHYERALGMLNHLFRINPADLNIRFLLAQILIDHYKQFDLAEQVLQSTQDISSQKLVFLAQIASERGEKEKAILLVNQVMKKDVSISIAKRVFLVLKKYEQKETIKYYRQQIINNYPAPWREKISKEIGF